MKKLNFLICIKLCLLFTSSQSFAQIYLDSTASVSARVEDLLLKMSMQEKIGQMTQVERYDVIDDPVQIKNLRIGSVLSGGGSVPSPNTPKGWADMYDMFQGYALQTPLKIPIIYGIDAVHGHNNLINSTIFPHNIGMGCTRDSDLVTECERITALEVAATGLNWVFAPCIAVPRNERWGRTYEGFGETPELASKFAKAAVNGFQTDSLGRKNSIVACAKHFIGDGGTTDGVNTGNTSITEEELRAIHLPGYTSAVNSGVGTIMASFNSWNDSFCTSDKYLLTDILKTELNFKGFIVSDWEAINDLGSNYSDNIRQSINAGIDMAMVPNTYSDYITDLTSLVNAGYVTTNRINDAVSRILKIKFQMGLFEHPYADRSLFDTVGCTTHRQVARKAVRESMVLLKNNGVLPLSKTGTKILVVGSKANDIGIQCGGWTISWQGSTGNITKGTTLLQAIRQVQGSSNVLYTTNASLIPDADIAVVAVGEEPYAEGSGDRQDLSLESGDINLINAVFNKGMPMVVVLFSGRPMIISDELDKSDAFVAAWLPGTEGEGIADILYGDYDFKGKLSHSWPIYMEDIPINYGDSPYDPLFPYGYGLTYSPNPIDQISEKAPEIEIFPVPARDFIYIKNMPDKNLKFRIFDLAGSEVMTNDLTQVSAMGLIDIRNLKSGVYFLELQSGQVPVFTGKIIKH
jgi:beta-glucosidase